MSPAWATYRALSPALGRLAPWIGRLAPAAERELWSERLGEGAARGPVDAWIHAASMGEAVAVAALMRELAARAPGARFHLTSTTRTGRERLASLGAPASLAPLDDGRAARRFMERLVPERLFLVETELWPQWLLEADRRRMPVAVVSARLSKRSVAGYRWLGPGLFRLVAGLEAVLCQTEEDRSRWLDLGAREARVTVVGNLKNDALPEPATDRARVREALGLEGSSPLLVLGSLRPGEGAALARAWNAQSEATRRRWQVVAVPRHPHAAGAMRREVEGAGVPVAAADGPARATGDAAAPRPWRWDDRVGVLRGYYAAADLAVVGGAFAPLGGHNPLEPAACGAAVIMGPHHESQRGQVRALREAQAIELAEPGPPLRLALAKLLEGDDVREAMGRAASEVARAARGAARRAVDRLGELSLWPV